MKRYWLETAVKGRSAARNPFGPTKMRVMFTDLACSTIIGAEFGSHLGNVRLNTQGDNIH